MRNHASDEALHAWQTQPRAIAMSPLTAALLRRAVRRHAWLHFPNDILGIVFITAIGIFFAAMAIGGEIWLCRIGAALFSAAAFHAAFRTFVWRTRLIPSEPGAMDCLSYYRTELMRKREQLKTFLSWGVWPFAPGVVLASLGWLLAAPREWYTALGILAVWAGTNLAVWAGHSRRIAAIERELKLLDT